MIQFSIWAPPAAIHQGRHISLHSETAGEQAEVVHSNPPTLAVGRYHGSIMAFIRYGCSSRKAGGAMGATALACYPLGSGTSVPTAHLDGCVAKPWQYATIHQLSIVSDDRLTHGGNLRHPCSVKHIYGGTTTVQTGEDHLELHSEGWTNSKCNSKVVAIIVLQFISFSSALLPLSDKKPHRPV